MLEVCDRFFVTERARCLYLFDRIRQLKEPPGPIKKVGTEIRAETVADNGDVQVDGDGAKLINHRRAAKLSLINEDAAHPIELLAIYLGISEDLDVRWLLNSDTGTDHVSAEPIIESWLNENHLSTLAPIVVRYGEKVKGLSAANGTVPEIEFCHVERTPKDSAEQV